MVCIIDRDTDLGKLSSDVASHDDVWMMFATGAMTRAIERELLELLTEDDGYRVVTQTKRFAYLNKGWAGRIGNMPVGLGSGP
jgi:hypothetical protein